MRMDHGRVLTERRADVLVVTINRPEVRNAVDAPTADALFEAFDDFDSDRGLAAAVLTGAGGSFCAGADLKRTDIGQRRVSGLKGAPMGPTRRLVSKPVIAAVEGYAVAGGLELALWCDLRVAASDAVFGVFCRRFGVPLIDGGTVRLPRLIGQSRALDMILTGRPVSGEEALSFGLANRLSSPGSALTDAVELASRLAAFPQSCLRSDRLSAYGQWEHSIDAALEQERRLGIATIATGETAAGAARFAAGEGRHGGFAPPSSGR